MRERWKYVVPRLYLDTCSVADALLEPAIGAKPPGGHNLEVFLSQRIFAGWPEENLLISPFVLAEFIQLGHHSKYSRSLSDMRDVVEKRLLPRTKLAFTECDLSIARTYDVTGLDPKFLVRLHLEGNATMPNGERFQGIRGTFQITRAGQIIRSASGGIPPDSEGLSPDAKWDADTRVSIEAPAFELSMLDTVAQIVHETNAPWKDAFHYLYAKWAHADMIMSTDKEFAHRVAERDVNLPGVVPPSFIEERVRGTVPPFHKEVFF
jgi:hypothetical protein